ncbi:TPX2 (targeting protein for Xklp2) protein family [Trifolium repens]|nr:TPX2 (targeting protein for Xklp2) protein family [Trifolium repens]
MASTTTIETMTPSRVCRSKSQQTPKNTENVNPNTPPPSCSSKKPRNPINPNSVRNKLRQRKFVVVAKKKQKEIGKEGSSGPSGDGDADSRVLICNCKEKNRKCVCVAYHNLRKSQEEFFKNRDHEDEDNEEEEIAEIDSVVVEKEVEKQGEVLIVKRSRERLREEVRESVTQIGSGKVKNLVKAFEKLLVEPDSKDEDQKEENDEKEVKENDKKVSGSSFCPSDLILTSQNLGLDPRASVSSSWDGSRGSLTSRGGRSSRRNSLESSTTTVGGTRRLRKKLQKVTRPEPFKLRTDQRGKVKEEVFVQKVQQMKTEEEKQRIPVAQGLPWTTDEPECLAKPPVKEITIPVDLKLHTDMRALGRAEFDEQVAEKLLLIEQYKLEKEREQKLAEEEEIKRLRKELVPKAQPMPYFDRPFIPRRSMKCPTLPKEPKFHKKVKCSSSSSSWSDMNSYSSCLN